MNYTQRDIVNIKKYSSEEILNDFKKLENIDCSDITQSSNLGSKIMNHFFFKYTINVRGQKNVSFVEFLNDKELLNKPYFKSFIKNNMKDTNNPLKIYLRYFKLYLGSISLFKPSIAKFIFCKFKPHTVLDFSAGWGGRLIGALSIPDIQYIGFDTNKDLRTPYKKLLNFLHMEDRAKIFFIDSSKVNFSKFKYDMVFTSPPYYTKEKYHNMPEYTSLEDFNENFFFPVVKNSYKYLQNGGTYALNIPKNMYEDIKSILGKAHQKIELYLSSNRKYNEYIYIWFKP